MKKTRAARLGNTGEKGSEGREGRQQRTGKLHRGGASSQEGVVMLINCCFDMFFAENVSNPIIFCVYGVISRKYIVVSSGRG